MSKTVQDPSPPPAAVVGTITQFLTTLPSPLTISLVSFTPQIRFVRWALEVVSWRGSWDESWLLLAGWWAVCLGAEVAVRYAFPILAVLAWWLLTRRAVARATHPQAATEETLQQTLADLTTIHELLPRIPPPKHRNDANSDVLHAQSPDATPISLYTLLRVLAFTYPLYLFLTMTSFVRIRTLLAILGTLVIIHRAPFALTTRRVLWRSAYFRWSVYWTWAKISGTPLPGSVQSIRSEASPVSVFSQSGAAAKGTKQSSPAGPIRFLFTVYENQRWWMGLDWTAALLPGERPSWCSRSLHPCQPPAAFSLPPPTTVYLPDPAGISSNSQTQSVRDGKKDGKGEGKKVMKRTATWSWEEPEWKVVVRKEGATSTVRVERPLPSLVEEGASAGAGRILRAAGKIRGASVDLSPERKMKDLDTGKDKDGGHAKERERSEGEKSNEDSQGQEDEEPYTDPDGWVYGDNKWEGGSAKGGMAKFTRFRRWSRVAVLKETIEWVDESDIPSDVKSGKHVSGIPLVPLQEPTRQQSEPTPSSSHTFDTPLMSPTRKPTLETTNFTASGHGRTASMDRGATSPVSATDEGSRLRQRLKAVVSGVGH